MSSDFSNGTKQYNNYKYNNQNYHNNQNHNQQSGYGMHNYNQYQQSLGLGQGSLGGQQANYISNSYGGFLPDQNVYYSPYGSYPVGGIAGQATSGVAGVTGNSTQNSYPYGYNFQGQPQAQFQQGQGQAQIYDQNSNAQYQQMLLNSLPGSARSAGSAGNPQLQYNQGSIITNPNPNPNSIINVGSLNPLGITQSQSTSLSDSQSPQVQFDMNSMNAQYLQQLQMGGYIMPGYDLNQMNTMQIPQDQINNNINESESESSGKKQNQENDN